jgi:HEAT repeat protein
MNFHEFKEQPCSISHLPALKCTLMPGKRAFEEQLAALDALREQPDEVRIPALRKALGHKNNFVVGKAADLVRELQLTALNESVVTAFDRFFDNPVKSDAQCWAKNAISRALAAFEYQDVDLFLRGMRHIQMEPVWGGSSDTAGTLRATCALALVQCRTLSEVDLMKHLVELFADKDKSVRVEAVRAVEQVGSSAASLLLRLRATLGADEPEVLGACYGGILRVEGNHAIPWVARFLATGDDAAGEAALAIAGTRSEAGFEVLRKCVNETSDPWFLSVLLSAIALTRQEAGVEFLLDLIGKESMQAEAAMEAILRAAPSADLMERVKKLVAGNPRLARVLAEHRNSARR